MAQGKTNAGIEQALLSESTVEKERQRDLRQAGHLGCAGPPPSRRRTRVPRERSGTRSA